VKDTPSTSGAERDEADADVILNPRRCPRVRLCCPSRLSAGEAFWSVTTEDLGPRGCQLVSERSVASGRGVHLVVSAPGMTGELSVAGTVVWASPAAPYRLGVAFSERHAGVTSRWFEDLLRCRPDLHVARYVRGIPAGATLRVCAPPRFLPDFTADEAALLLEIGAGLRAGELRERFQATWSQARHALFSLVARRLVTTTVAESVPVARWHAFHAHLGALAAEARRRGGALSPAGARARPEDAQELYQAALSEIAGGRPAAALVSLRRALVRAPGDAEIAATLVRVALGRAGANPASRRVRLG